MQQREILFRGKNYKGKWVFGHYAYCFNYPDDSIKKHWILDGETEDGQRGDYEIDPATLGQYTGLPDKSGKKIFEGDILSDGSYSNIVVRWSERLASFALVREGWLHTHFFGESAEASYYEIIGNIHDNPEMIATLGE